VHVLTFWMNFSSLPRLIYSPPALRHWLIRWKAYLLKGANYKVLHEDDSPLWCSASIIMAWWWRQYTPLKQWRYIPQGCHLPALYRKNLKSKKVPNYIYLSTFRLSRWVSTVADYTLDDRGSIPGRVKPLSRPASKIHPASYAMGTGGPFTGVKRGVTLTTHSHIVLISRMSRSYIPSPVALLYPYFEYFFSHGSGIFHLSVKLTNSLNICGIN
jgi:hypothetical protein